MLKPILVSAALAAGLTTLAAQAQEAPQSLGRAELVEAFAAPAAVAAEPAAGVDATTTASVPPAKRPKLVARARSAPETAVTGADAPRGAGKEAPRTAPRFAANAYSPIITRYAAEHGVPVDLAHAVVQIESNFRPEARGKAGEIGLMQIKPATARMMGYSGSAKGLHDPETNVRYGMKYLARARALAGGATCGTILKYNAGHGAKRMNGVSAAYCARVRHLTGG